MSVIRVTPDKERAKSLLETIEVRLDSIELMEKADVKKFASKIVEEWYDVILEFVTAIMSADGYKISSDTVGGHIDSIQHMRNYGEILGHDIELMNELRKRRVGIKYYGRRVSDVYLKGKEKNVKDLVRKLREMTNIKLQN